MCGIESYVLNLNPELVCEPDDLDALMNVDALVITLPARRSGPGEDFYLQAMQEIVDSALAYRIPRIIFYQLHLGVWRCVRRGERELAAQSGHRQRTHAERAGRLVAQSAGHVGGHSAAGGLVGPARHPRPLLPAKPRRTATTVLTVHLEDVIAAITLCCNRQKAAIFIISAPRNTRRAQRSTRRWRASLGWSRRNSPPPTVRTKVNRWMAAVSVMNWGLNISIRTRCRCRWNPFFNK